MVIEELFWVREELVWNTFVLKLKSAEWMTFRCICKAVPACVSV
jgi:hypothetical protein